MNEIMTLNEIADYLKIAPKTVSRMIQRNEIPCFKISGQWRFKKSTIDNWLDTKMNNTKPKFNNSYNDISFLPLYRLINEKYIVLDICKNTNKEILKQLLYPLEQNKLINNTNKLLTSLLNREAMASTTLSNGVAFPHCRKPEDNLDNLPPIILGISKEGVQYGEIKNNKTYIFFLILVNDEIMHLKILSKLANFINRGNILDKLKNIENKHEIIKLLMESEYEYMS